MFLSVFCEVTVTQLRRPRGHKTMLLVLLRIEPFKGVARSSLLMLRVCLLRYSFIEVRTEVVDGYSEHYWEQLLGSLCL